MLIGQIDRSKNVWLACLLVGLSCVHPRWLLDGHPLFLPEFLERLLLCLLERGLLGVAGDGLGLGAAVEVNVLLDRVSLRQGVLDLAFVGALLHTERVHRPLRRKYLLALSE